MLPVVKMDSMPSTEPVVLAHQMLNHV